MTLVDSHCHLNTLDLEKYDGDLQGVLDAAKQHGIEQFLCVGISLDKAHEPIAIAEKYPEVKASVGLHPSEKVEVEPTVDDLIKLASNPEVVAIGETGLDYHYNEGDLTWQQNRFRTHIEAGIQMSKPIIIHTREAKEDTIKIMREANADQCGGVMHCFTEDWEMAQQALDLNFYISISGIVTFKKATQIQEVASKIPLDRLLIETDSPYLAPVPFRGKQNEPQYVRFVAEKVAELRGTTVEAIAKATTNNYRRLFKL